MRPQRWQPTRLPRPWDSLGKNTGVGCHALFTPSCWKPGSHQRAQNRAGAPQSPCHYLTYPAVGSLKDPFYRAGFVWLHPEVDHCEDLSPGVFVKNTAATAAAKSLQSCPTLCDPIDGSPPGSAVPGILQARTLEWVAISFSNVWKWKVKGKSLSRVWLFATPWTAAHQAPPSMAFSRQEYWSGLPLPSLHLWTIFLKNYWNLIKPKLSNYKLKKKIKRH